MAGLAGFEPATFCLEDRRSDSAELQALVRTACGSGRLSVVNPDSENAEINHPLPQVVLTSWWSELESNQPLGFFKPTLSRLSYPTLDIADCRFSIADFKLQTRFSIGNWHSTIGNVVRPSAFARYVPCP